MPQRGRINKINVSFTDWIFGSSLVSLRSGRSGSSTSTWPHVPIKDLDSNQSEISTPLTIYKTRVTKKKGGKVIVKEKKIQVSRKNGKKGTGPSIKDEEKVEKANMCDKCSRSNRQKGIEKSRPEQIPNNYSNRTMSITEVIDFDRDEMKEKNAETSKPTENSANKKSKDKKSPAGLKTTIQNEIASDEVEIPRKKNSVLLEKVKPMEKVPNEKDQKALDEGVRILNVDEREMDTENTKHEKENVEQQDEKNHPSSKDVMKIVDLKSTKFSGTTDYAPDGLRPKQIQEPVVNVSNSNILNTDTQPQWDLDTAKSPDVDQVKQNSDSEIAPNGVETRHQSTPNRIDEVDTKELKPPVNLLPDEIWSDSDCKMLERLMSKYKEHKWHCIQDGFFIFTGRMIDSEVIRRKFLDDDAVHGKSQKFSQCSES